MPQILDNLVCAYEFEDSGDLGADAVGSEDLTNTNTATQVAGVVAEAVQFVVGSSQSLHKAADATLRTGGGSFAVAFWHKRTWAALAGLIRLGDGGDIEWAFDGRDNRTDLRIFNSGTVTVSGDPFTADTWMFCIGWYDADADTLNIQHNNGSVNTQSSVSAGPSLTASNFRISNNVDGFPYCDGLIDQVMYWKGYVPTSDERTWLYNGGAGRSYADLLALDTPSIALPGIPSSAGFGAFQTAQLKSVVAPGIPSVAGFGRFAAEQTTSPTPSSSGSRFPTIMLLRLLGRV